MDYALPRADTFPPVELRRVESPSTVNPLGVKGTGEGGSIPGQAVIASAIADALGEDGPELDVVPIRPERVLAMLRRRTA